MFPAKFDYVAPTTLDEALAILAEHGNSAKILSGGQSLVPLLKIRLVQPTIVIDINRIPGLDQIGEDDQSIRIGSLVRHQRFASDPIIGRHFPWFSKVVPLIADRQVRSRGTMAGTLVEADPAGDWSAVLLALDASVHAVGPSGPRVIACRDWFEYSFTPALADDEIVREIEIARPTATARGSYVKLERRAGDFAVAACAVHVDFQTDGIARSVRVGLTGVGPVPMVSESAASVLVGRRWSDEVLHEAANAIMADVQPLADSRGSSEYKRAMSGVVFRRAAMEAALGSPTR